MFYVQFYILVIITNVITIHGYDGRRLRFFGKRRTGSGIKLNDQISENREELRRIIEMLNGHLRDGKRERDLDSNRIRAYGADLDDDGVVDEQVDRLKGLLGRLQRSYDTRLKEPEDLSNSRIHVIANPEVLEEFKRRIRAQVHSTSSEDSDTNLSGALTTYYKKGVKNRNNNRGLFTDVENVSSDVDKYPFIAPANKGNVIVVMRKSRLGKPQRAKKGDEDEKFEGSQISWGQMEASHEKISPSKIKKPNIDNYGLDVSMPKNVVKNQPTIYSDEAPPLKPYVKNVRDYDSPKSPETWSKPKMKQSISTWDDEEPRPKKSNKNRGGGHGNSRTSIPYIGKHSIYEK